MTERPNLTQKYALFGIFAQCRRTKAWFGLNAIKLLLNMMKNKRPMTIISEMIISPRYPESHTTFYCNLEPLSELLWRAQSSNNHD